MPRPQTHFWSIGRPRKCVRWLQTSFTPLGGERTAFPEIPSARFEAPLYGGNKERKQTDRETDIECGILTVLKGDDS